MASKTTKTKKRRKQKLAAKGKERKRAIRRDGSTPTQAELFGDE